MATRTRSRSPIRSAGSNQRDVEPEAAAASGRDVSPDTLELIATMESIDSLGEEWTNGAFRCYICSRYTLSPVNLGVLRNGQADCPHVACSFDCLVKLDKAWRDIKYELEDLERELPKTD